MIKMNSQDQLLDQSAALLGVIDELISMIRKAKDELDKDNFSEKQLFVLNDHIKKTLNLAKVFMRNYNEFIENQVESS